MDKVDESVYTQVTEQWVREVVVGLNLCPFAAEPLKLGRIRYAVCGETAPDDIFRSLLLEMEALINRPEAAVETSLFIVPQGLESFDDFLEILYSADEAIPEAGLDGVLQLASFHPDYRFEGATRDDPANYTNRSPFPMFHLIREESLERALSSYPNPELIPQRNIETLRSLGLAEVQRRLRLTYRDVQMP